MKAEIEPPKSFHQKSQPHKTIDSKSFLMFDTYSDLIIYNSIDGNDVILDFNFGRTILSYIFNPFQNWLPIAPNFERVAKKKQHKNSPTKHAAGHRT